MFIACGLFCVVSELRCHWLLLVVCCSLFAHCWFFCSLLSVFAGRCLLVVIVVCV